MKKRVLELTETEFDLIESVRNYKRSYPNGDPELRWYINVLFAEITPIKYKADLFVFVSHRLVDHALQLGHIIDAARI